MATLRLFCKRERIKDSIGLTLTLVMKPLTNNPQRSWLSLWITGGKRAQSADF